MSADVYARFMGRFADPLAVQFIEFAGVRAGQRALDVGCGPGALTVQLVDQLGADSVAAIEPSAPFVEAVRERCPGVDVRAGVAEDLPYPDDSFDVALAQLVVHFMKDPVAGLREMARVTRPGGRIAACVWDHAGDSGPPSPFWRAVRETDPDARDESDLAGAREGHLVKLCEEAGLDRIEGGRLTVRVGYASFHDWWEPYTFGVGPAGAYVATLDDVRRESLRASCAQLLPPAPFDIDASAWCVRAYA